MPDAGALVNSLVSSSPFAALLLWLWWQERKERRELQERLLASLKVQADTADAVRRILSKKGSKDGDND